MKDQLYLFSLLVFFVGIVFTEAYYAVFNLKYQTLSMPVFHIVYRGITAIFHNWFILLIYVLTAVWLAIQDIMLAKMSEKNRILSSVMPYLFVGFLITANYPLAKFAGMSAAKMDMYEATCTLPRIIVIKNTNNSSTNYAGARLLGIDGSYVILFWPLKLADSESVPNIFRINKEKADVIQTSVK